MSAIQELLDAMPTPAARLAVMNWVARHSGRSVYVPLDSKRERRERAAENMLRNGMEDAEARRVLCERFPVSERTAWQTVADSRRKIATENCEVGRETEVL